MTTSAFANNAMIRAASGFADPYEIAYLRGGPAEVIRLAVFALNERGALEITERRELLSKVRRLRQTRQVPMGLAPVESAVHRHAAQPRRAVDMLGRERLAEVEQICAPYRLALLERGYLRSAWQHRQLMLTLLLLGIAAGLLVLPIAGIWPAVLVMAVGAIVCRWWAPVLRISGRGRRALRQAETGIDEGPNMTAVALWGLNILETTDYDALPLMFSASARRSNDGGTEEYEGHAHGR